MKVGPSKRSGNLAILVAILSFLLLGSPALAQNKPKPKGGEAYDKYLLAASEALLLIDMFQTQHILKNDNVKETNPILNRLGPNYAPLYFLACLTLNPIIGEAVLPKYKTAWYSIITSIELQAVGRNIYLNVGFAF